MKQRKELFSLQLPLSLDCGENGPLEHAQALFAAIQPDDTLYILDSPANDPEGIVSEAFVRALEVAGPTVSQWADFEFRLTAQTEDGAAISLLQPHRHIRLVVLGHLQLRHVHRHAHIRCNRRQADHRTQRYRAMKNPFRHENFLHKNGGVAPHAASGDKKVGSADSEWVRSCFD